MPFVGSGKFAPVRVWSCPDHDKPVEHHCDCHLCTWKEPACCANAKWIDRLDRDGNIVTYELSTWEEMLLDVFREDFWIGGRVLQMLTTDGAKYEWIEDNLISRIGSNDV